MDYLISDKELALIKATEKSAMSRMICAGPGCNKPLDPVIAKRHNDPYHKTECCKRAYGIIDGSVEEDEEREKFRTRSKKTKAYRIKK